MVSLGSLLFYCDKIKIKQVNVIYLNQEDSNLLIRLFGVQRCNLKTMKPSDCKDFYIKEYMQKHCFMEVFGYLIKINSKVIYYFGDTKSIPNEILNLLLENKIDYFYQDLRKNLNDYHISIEEILSIVTENYWEKIN